MLSKVFLTGIVAVAAGVSSLLPGRTDVHTKTPAPQSMQMGSASTTLSGYGKSVHLLLYYPLKGGTVSGTIKGDCVGTISGIYQGSKSGTLKGDAQANCNAGFISFPVQLSYNGKLNLKSSNAAITYAASGLGMKRSGYAELALQ